MANYSSLLAAVNAAITANGTGAITGPVLNTVLQQMIVSLGQGGYIFKGRAIPTTNPNSPDQNVFYIATTPGTYTNFSSIVVAAGECAILKGSGTSWSKEATGIDLVSVSQNSLTIGGDYKGELAGQLIDNPEWVKVATDNDGKVLYGVKLDGKFYFGDGCPPQVQEYVINYVNTYGYNKDTIDSILATKVDKVIGKSLIDADFASSQSTIENPEFLKVQTDSEQKVLEAITTDGIKQINIPIKTPSFYIDSIENPEWLWAEADSEGKVFCGRKKNGVLVEYCDVNYPNGIPTDIKEYADKNNYWKGKTICFLGTSITYGATAETCSSKVASEILGFNLIQTGVPGLAISFLANGDFDTFGSSCATIAEYEAAGWDMPSSPTGTYAPNSYNNYYRTYEHIFRDENLKADLFVFAVAPNNDSFGSGDYELFDLDNWKYTDNSAFSTHRNTFFGALVFLLNELWARKPYARVAFLFETMHTVTDAEPFMDAIAEKYHIPFIKLNRKWQVTPFNSTQVFSDGTHPTTLGQQQLGYMLANELLLIR